MKYFAILALLFLPFCFAWAQEVHQDLQEILTADIVRIVGEEAREIVGTTPLCKCNL
jgi:hypothetical protein